MTNNRIAYAILKDKGIDTSDMTPKVAWDKVNEIATKESMTTEQLINQYTQHPKPLVEDTSDIPPMKKVDYRQRDMEMFLGPEYKNLKGRAAIEKLLLEKRGHVKDAFYNQELGPITLFWGDSKSGLCHIFQKHRKDIPELRKKLDSVIKNGDVIHERDGRFRINFKGKTAVIETQFSGDDFVCVITAYINKKAIKT